jgi:hypothetical protein
LAREVTANDASHNFEQLLWLVLMHSAIERHDANYRPASAPAVTEAPSIKPAYAAFFNAFGRFYESAPMTESEFRQFSVNGLPLPP